MRFGGRRDSDLREPVNRERDSNLNWTVRFVSLRNGAASRLRKDIFNPADPVLPRDALG